MKPIKLEMSAFGSYAGKTELDFTAVNHGIFLITGDTGSGKTTIYDAITYALYEKTSGNQREGNMMRSQYAELDMPTYVRLTFEYTGNEYTIVRNPEYARESKRKKADGSSETTTENAKVSLIMPDGSEYMGKKTEINKKIVDIIGLDANQFSQVAMIAQGDFLKLLHANSDERKIIFSKIFNTKIYYKIQEELKNRFKSIYGQLEDNKKECAIIINGVEVAKDSEFLEGFLECKDSIEPDFVRLMPILKNIKDELESKQKEINAKEIDLEKVLEDIAAGIKAAYDTNELFDQLEKTKVKSQELQEKESFINQMILQSERAHKAEKVAQAEEKFVLGKRAFDESEIRSAELKSWIEKNQITISEKHQVLELLKEQKSEEESKLQQIIAKIDAAIATDESVSQESVSHIGNYEKNSFTMDFDNIKTLQELIVQYSSYNLDFAKMEADVVDLAQRKESIKKLSEDIKLLKKFDANQKIDFEKLEHSVSGYRKQHELYEHLYDAFLNEQAGILAKDLQEGEACPVCGSTSHPNKTSLSESAVTQDQVNAAKKERDLLEVARDRANAAFVVSKGEYDKELDYIERESRKIISAEFVADENGFLLIAKNLDETVQKLDAAQRDLLQVKQMAKKYRNDASKRLQYLNVKVEEESKNYQNLVNELKTKSGAAENEKTNCIKLQKEYMEFNEIYLKTVIDNGFVDENDYKISKRSEIELKGFKEKIEAFRDVAIRTNESIQLYTSQTKDKVRVEAESLKTKQNTVMVEKKNLADQHRIVYSNIKNNGNAFDKLEKLSLKRASMKKEFETISALSKTANGNLSGSAKIDFETYVLRQYFRQIISAANRRLLKMVSNQFMLQCRDIDSLKGQGASGLDLDVFSLVTNSARDVKTLSGGESFMAALSMALGMADVIQNSAGSVHLDTMFIDEGFGSLDDESREQAIMILNELAGDSRLVGIISHVTELKEQIDRKLIVEKSEKGSRIRWSL